MLEVVTEVWAPWDVTRVSCHDHLHGGEAADQVHQVDHEAVHSYQAFRQSEYDNSAMLFGNSPDLFMV